MKHSPAIVGVFAAVTLAVAFPYFFPAAAQAPGGGWDAGINAPGDGSGNITVMPRTSPGTDEADADDRIRVRLVAYLTVDGQRINKGLVWRIYQKSDVAGAAPQLLMTYRSDNPVAKVPPGNYVINVAFGRANLTRTITVRQSTRLTVEKFILNAGGLRVSATVSGVRAAPNTVTYTIYSDRDQTDTRKVIMNSVKPGLIIRLNAGIYHIVSNYGDANAVIASDVNVEAGKLTEATVAHAAAKVTFKLVARAGGEALPDTKWTIQTTEGRNVKTSIGALPTHVLAPGSYIAVAKSQGKVFSREFSINDGETTQIEVVVR